MSQLRATVDVHIHSSFEPENASFEAENAATRVSRWLVLDVSMPAIVRPLRRLIVTSFDQEPADHGSVNKYAEAHTGDAPDA